ncbi:MAG: hypothetical protein J6Y12_05370 [Lachnospiraceae bacterium]|nr:hypothetical protein [Lachnospiraceae bacterium]
MESVYFGKENNESPDKDEIKAPLTPYMTGPSDQGSSGEYTEVYTREYYFPDENNIKLKTESFLSRLFGSAVADFIVLCIIMPVAYINLYLSTPVLYFAETQVIYTATAVIFYAALFILLFFLIHNSFRRKIYVLEGRTLYELRKTVRVKTWKKGFFSTAEKADKRIHERYAGYCAYADRHISEKSHHVRKILTSAYESGDINDKGRLFSGFNEKKMNDDEILIPHHYIKYDPTQTYFRKNPLRKVFFVLFRLALYGACIFYILSAGIKKTEVYNREIGSFTESWDKVMEPLGFEREENNIPGFYFENIDYIDDSDTYLHNSVRLYFDVTEEGLKFTGYFVNYDLHYGDDTSKIYEVMNLLYDLDIRETADIDSMIEEYSVNNGTDITNTLMTDDYYIDLTVKESYWADYSVYIYVRTRHRDIFN